MNRRSFVTKTLAAGASMTLVPGQLWAQSAATASTPVPHMPDADPKWRKTWDAALAVLAGNVQVLPRYDKPVLIEGATYMGVWQECAPQESQVYASLAKYVPVTDPTHAPLTVAKQTHETFFDLQREDGQMPAANKKSAIGFGQIQMVVPIAATAWEVAQASGDHAFLEKAYTACSRWDAWLRAYRDTRKTGLVEGFCTYDTGHDNSPRWKGVPGPCPNGDAKQIPPIKGLPRLCPDLSATVYGGRIALAAMAAALGKKDDHARWLADAEHIRQLILTKLYVPEDGAFYDLDADGQFVRVRSDVISRILGEHVVDPVKDRAIFEAMWTKQLHNPQAFWGKYPLASIAMDDPTFVRPIPRNSWGGASQALTALRTIRWMPYYGKQAEMLYLMHQWAEAISRHGQFNQQMDPMTGEMTVDPGAYSPAALVYLQAIVQLSLHGKGKP